MTTQTLNSTATSEVHRGEDGLHLGPVCGRETASLLGKPEYQLLLSTCLLALHEPLEPLGRVALSTRVTSCPSSAMHECKRAVRTVEL